MPGPRVKSASLAAALAAAVAGCGTPADPDPRPLSVTPDRGLASEAVEIVIAGSDFTASAETDFEGRDPSTLDARFQATLGGTALRDVQLHADGTLTATVPEGIAAGLHDLTVIDPEGRSGTLTAAYQALDDADAAQLVASYRIAPIAPQQAWAPFGVTITALDAGGSTVTAYSGAVTLTDLTGTAVPGAPALFVHGVWSGTVEVRTRHAADVLSVSDALGRSGASDPFAVAPTPPAALRFSTPARATAAGGCSGPAQPLTIELLDAFGLPTVASGPLPLSATPFPGLTLYSDPACATPASSPSFPADAGSITLWFRSTLAGAATVELSATGVTAAAQVETVVAGAPAKVLFVSAPQTLAAGGCSAPATVEVRDAWGNAATGGAVPVDVGAAPASGFTLFADAACTTPASTVSSSAATARADFWFRGTAAQAVTVTASGSSLAADSQVETVTSEASPARLVFLNPARSVVAGACSDELTVQAQDSFGNPVTGAVPLAVGLAALPAPGLAFFADAACATPLPGAASIPAGQSAVTFHFRGTVAASETVTGSAPALSSATQVETVAAAPPDQLLFSTPPRTVMAGVCSPVVTLELRDAYGNPTTASSTLAISLTATPSSGFELFADAGCTVPAAGVEVPPGGGAVGFHFKASAVGAFNVAAAASGLGGASQDETVDPAGPDHLVFTTGAKSVTAGSCSGGVTLDSLDPFGNPAPVAAATTVDLTAAPPTGVTFYLGASCAGAPVTAVTLPGGGDTVTLSFRATSAGTFTLSAAAAGMAPDPTQDETVVAAPPDRLLFDTPAQELEAGGCSAVATVRAWDGFGNPSSVAGDTPVSLGALPASGFAFYSDATCTTPIAAATIAAGAQTASFHFRGTLVGGVTVSASVGGWTPASQLETIHAGAATHFAWDAIPTPQSADRAFSVRLTALDAWNNVDTAFASAADLSLTWSGTPSPDPTLSCTAGCAGLSATFSSGVWTGAVSVSVPGSVDPAIPDRWLVATAGAVTGTSNAFAVTGVPLRSPPTAHVTATPAVAFVGDPVILDASGSTDYQTATADLMVSWDLLGTATAPPAWPTPAAPWTAWTTLKTASTTFPTWATYEVRVAVRDADGDVGYGIVLVRARGVMTYICRVDTTNDVDDAAVTTCANAATLGDRHLSLREALRVAGSGDTIAFSGPMTFTGSATYTVPRQLEINGPGVLLDGPTLVINGGTSATPVVVIGLELANQTTPVQVNDGHAVTFQDVLFRDGARIESSGWLTLERTRMERCAGSCVRLLDTAGTDTLTVRYSQFLGAGSGTALDVAQCTAGTNALVVQSSLFNGFQNAIQFGCAGVSTIRHATFEANGTGIAYYAGAASAGHSLRNSIFTNQAVAAASCGLAAFTNRDYHLLWQNGSPGCLGADAGLLSTDPLYLYPSQGDFRLSLGSPAVDSAFQIAPSLSLIPAFPTSAPYWLGTPTAPDRGAFETW